MYTCVTCTGVKEANPTSPGNSPAEVTRKQYICTGLLVVNGCRTCPIIVPVRELTGSAPEAAVGR